MKTHFKIRRTLFSAPKKYPFTIALIATLAIGTVAHTNAFPFDGNAGVGTTAPPSYECEGNACPVVTLTWEENGQQFRVDNSSSQRVKVEVTTYAGTSSITVEPQKSDYLRVTYFNGPYHANYEQLVSRASPHAAAFLIDLEYSRIQSGDSWNTN